ncbi:uncharacterized protein METZ01_LOCUS110419, partial [marine metagenome]
MTHRRCAIQSGSLIKLMYVSGAAKNAADGWNDHSNCQNA